MTSKFSKTKNKNCLDNIVFMIRFPLEGAIWESRKSIQYDICKILMSFLWDQSKHWTHIYCLFYDFHEKTLYLTIDTIILNIDVAKNAVNEFF